MDAAATPEKLTQQQIYQCRIDIVALLGRVNIDISDIRKKHAVSVLKPEFKCLTTQTKSSNSKLFGENVSKVLKSIDITNKVGGKIKKYSRPSYHKKESQDRSYKGDSQSFLGQGRNSWHRGRKNYHNHHHHSNSNSNRNQKRKSN